METLEGVELEKTELFLEGKRRGEKTVSFKLSSLGPFARLDVLREIRPHSVPNLSELVYVWESSSD